MIDPKTAGRAAIEDDAVVIRFPVAAMQIALDGAWGLNVFDKRQKITDEAEFSKEFCHALNDEDEQGTTMIHRMVDKVFIQMMENGAFGFDEHEDQSDAFATAALSHAMTNGQRRQRE